MKKARNSRRPALKTVCMPVALLLVCGCAGYRLGSTLPPGIRSVYVPTFENRTGEPQVDTEVTRATVQEFQRDGTLQLAGAAEADSQLHVAVVGYKLVPLRYERDNAKSTREYRLLLTAELEFARTGTGEVLAKRKVYGETTFELLGDLSTAKIEALPKAAEDLAHDIVETVVEHW